MARRTSSEAYHYLYSSKQWRGTHKGKYRDGLRTSVFIRDLYTCKHCKVVVSDEARNRHKPYAAICNHIVRHEGNEDLFFDIDNLECCCKSCHDGIIQSMEKGGRMIRDDGWTV